MKWLALAIVAASLVLAGAYVLVDSGAVREDEQRVCVEREKLEPGELMHPLGCAKWDYR